MLMKLVEGGVDVGSGVLGRLSEVGESPLDQFEVEDHKIDFDGNRLIKGSKETSKVQREGVRVATGTPRHARNSHSGTAATGEGWLNDDPSFLF